ncbi:MAG TPA: hypothetical protein VL523_05555 [Terriglobia bacterium]|nr:hypothetical protein [Terriglobia bacterium]
MKWLTALETDNEPITLCRLMNAFRRKGVKIVNLTMSAAPQGFTLLALVETGPGEIEHLRNFLRRTEGVARVACYRHERGEEAPFAFDPAEPAHLTGFLETLPGASVTFTGEGRYLVEYPPVFSGAPGAEQQVEMAFLPN